MNKFIKYSNTILFVLTLGYVLGQAIFGLLEPLRTDDTFWHLKIGELISQTKSLPEKEMLLFTANPLYKPIYHEWMFQVFIYKIYSLFGMYSLRFVLLFLVLLIFLILINFFSLFIDSFFLKISGIILFILFSYQRLIQLRPEIFSIIFFYYILFLIIKNRRDFSFQTKAIACLLCMIWANIHSLSPIIFPFWLVFICLGAYLKKIDLKGNILGFIVAALFETFNPMGFKIYLFYFLGNARNLYSNVIDEWGHFNIFGQSDFLPLSSPFIIVLFFALNIVVLKKIIQNKNGNLNQALLVCFSILSLGAMWYAVRFFWLSAIPIVLLLLLINNNFFSIFILAIVSFGHFNLESTAIYHFPNNSLDLFKKYVSWPYDKVKYHEAALSFMKTNNIQGNVVNPYYMGGAISFFLYPNVKVFCDGRFEHYTNEVNMDHYELMLAGKNFKKILAKYPINLFFLTAEDETQKIRRALNDSGFKPIYRDFDTVIYKKL